MPVTHLLQKIYVAHGSNSSWEWLKTISPCINLLRKLANQVHATVGSYQGRTHKPADLTRDINELMKSLEGHNVYEISLGRRVEGGEPVVDLYSAGLQQLTYGPSATLEEYRQEFTRLQERCKVMPLQPFVATPPADQSNAATTSAAERNSGDSREPGDEQV